MKVLIYCETWWRELRITIKVTENTATYLSAKSGYTEWLFLKKKEVQGRGSPLWNCRRSCVFPENINQF